MQPFEVGMAGGFDAEDEELRGLVAVQLKQARFEGGELIGAGLEQEEGLRGGLDLALPAVDGLDGWNQGGAGGQPLFDQRAAQACCLLRIGRGGEDDAGWGAGFGQDFLVRAHSRMDLCERNHKLQFHPIRPEMELHNSETANLSRAAEVDCTALSTIHF